MGNQYKPISCGDYDYIEVACLYGYDVELVLGETTVRGKAMTTKRSDAVEYMVLQQADGESLSVRADEIVKLIVLTENARFSEHRFK